MGMTERSARLRNRLFWIVVAVIAAAASALYFTRIAGEHDRFEHSLAISPVLIAAGFALAAAYVVSLQFRSTTHAVTVDEVFLVVGFFALAPAHLIVAQIVGAGVVLGIVKHIPVQKLMFNLAMFALGTETGVVVFRSLASASNPLSPRSWGAAFAGCLAASAVALAAIVVAVMISEGRSSVPGMAHSIGFALLGTAVNAMLGLVAVIVLTESPLGFVLLIGPTAVVLIAYRAYLSEHAKTAGLEFLYAASEELNGARDIEGGLLRLLDFARDTFHAEIAEVVLTGDDGSAGYCTGAGPGRDRRVLASLDRSEADAFVVIIDGEADAMLLRGTHAMQLSTEQFACGSALVAALGKGADVRGVVYVARSRDAVEQFGKEELRLFETFVNHLGATLEKTRLNTSLARLRKAEQELAYQAYHDSLTGLANRVLFRDQVDEALCTSQPAGKLAVLFIDLDDFKTVNDTMGHAAGDCLLRQVSERIAAAIGQPNMAARIGGDEFAVLLRSVGHGSQVHLIANHVLSSLRAPIAIEDQQVVVRASIGVAFDDGTLDAAELMQRADVAMYTAKRNGKSRFEAYDPSMSLTVAHRHQLKVGLERAVGSEEFTVEYQPVADAATGSIMGTEALLRWRDPSRGMRRPGEFVSVAEDTGLIVPIGRDVLRSACARAAEWALDNTQLRMFVNLSARQLAHPEIVHDVAAALSITGLDASRLVLEMTETAMMCDVDEARHTLLSLKQLGVAIAIDDFGTGFSSLSYLRQLPIDMLKIAKPIIDLICDSPQDAAFVKGIIELGHVVGLEVVAEGVERAEQYASLVAMGCDFVQGFYYARSMAPEEMTRRLRADHDVTANEQMSVPR